MKLGTDEKKNLVNCAYFDERQAHKGAGVKTESFDALSAQYTALTDYNLPDST